MAKKIPQRSNHRSRWTLKELHYVEMYYHKKPTREIAQKLGRTEVAVRLGAQSLGVCKTLMPQWTEQEIEVLRTYYADGAGITYVQSLLPGRAKSSILAKANGLGIISARNWHAEEERILREFYPAIGTKVAKILPRRSVEAVKIKANQLGLRYRKLKPRETPARRWSDEEWCLLENNLALPYDELQLLLPGRSRPALEKAKERLKERRKRAQQ